MGEFPKVRGLPYFGVLITRILVCRVLYKGRPIFGNSQMMWSSTLHLVLLAICTFLARQWLQL